MRTQPPFHRGDQRSRHHGFSLLELTLVVAIMGVLVALCTPAVTQNMRSSRLNSSGSAVVDYLNYARQTAISRSLPVEVRIYKLPGYGAASTGSPSTYRAFQIFLINDTNSIALTKPVYFGNPVICSSIATESSLLDPTYLDEKTPSPSDSIPTYGLNYAYRSFWFRPSGSTNLPLTNLFLTLILEQGKKVSEGGNFLTIVIDPMTGRTNTVRP